MVTSSATTFAELLRRYRQQAGLTQQQLAERAGLSVHGIQKLERGATHPYRDTAQRLIAALPLDHDAETRFRAAVAPVHRHNSAPRSEASRGAHHNLPLPLTSLIGRDEDIKEVMARLANTRLLTLTGVGGCGKTRLALEVARGVVERYADGVWLVELGPIADPTVVATRVAAVMGVRETAEEPLTTSLIKAVGQRRVLFVIDNCEHLLDACAQLVDVLLRACSGLSVLATSREPIGTGGEVAWRVPSLVMPDADSVATPELLLLNPAVQLFVERAAAVQPRFELMARNAPAVVQICRCLDGIPLAIELAAARTDALTVEQIAQRLDQRFRLLTGGSRAALPRQQTLASTLDWSYELLHKPERLLFEQLSVFSGGWTLEAAEAICADDGLKQGDVVDVLARLTRKSLVVACAMADGAERYSLLETMREYARQKLAMRRPAAISALRDRHAEFYARHLELLLPNMHGEWSPEAPRLDSNAISQVEAEYDNIRSALAWWLESHQPAPGLRLAIRLPHFWMLRGLYAEARRWLVAFLELDKLAVGRDDHQSLAAVRPRAEGPVVARGDAISAIGTFANRQGDYQEALARKEECAAIWRELGDDLRLAISLSDLGLVAWLLGNATKAFEHLEDSRRALARCDRNPVTIGYASMILRNIGMVCRSLGDYERADDYFRESVSQDCLGIPTGGYNEARGLCQLGRTVFLRGDLTQAKQRFHEALAIMRVERLAGHTLADCLDWLAAAVNADGRPRDAARLFGAAEARWQASGGLRYSPERSGYAADVTQAQGKLTEAEFQAAWTEGHALSREQAVDYGLEQTGAY